MKSKQILGLFLITISLLGGGFYYISNKKVPDVPVQLPATNEQPINKTTEEATIANPASTNCISKGGNLKIITESNGSQFGLCQFKDYACEEWTYLRNECDIEGDAQKIRQELIAKGLNLSDSKVVIRHHLGKYIGGSVVPISEMGGGGYVFAVKEEAKIKILADGNGAILCSFLKDYPDFSTYLIPECVDETLGKNITR